MFFNTSMTLSTVIAKKLNLAFVHDDDSLNQPELVSKRVQRLCKSVNYHRR